MLDDNIDKIDGWMTGEDKSLVYTIYVAGTTRAQIDAGTATPQDISGWTLSFKLKARLEDPDASALISKITGAGITLTTPASGVATVALTDTDTDTLGEGKTYYHELKRTGDGVEAILSQGQVNLRQSVHRS